MRERRIIISLIGITLLLAPVIFIKNRIAKADHISNTLNIHPSTDSVINIAIIGDSWAYYASERGLCTTLDGLFLEKGIKTLTKNSGVPGARSKDIYNYLLSPERTIHPIRNLIESGTNYAILFCGINDQNGQYGPDFYSYHILNIMALLVEAGITPIYIELPEWNIKELYGKYDLWRYSCYKLLCGITSKQFDETATTNIYRQAFYDKLNQSAIKDHIIFIKWEDIKSDNIWADDLHLNETGYHSHCIFCQPYHVIKKTFAIIMPRCI